MMTQLEQSIHNDLLAAPDHELTTSEMAKAYHELMEGVRSRVDAEMMAYTFEQTKIQMQRQEQVVKAAAQGLGPIGGSGFTHAG